MPFIHNSHDGQAVLSANPPAALSAPPAIAQPSSRLVLLLASGAGLAVASLYYSQPMARHPRERHRRQRRRDRLGSHADPAGLCAGNPAPRPARRSARPPQHHPDQVRAAGRGAAGLRALALTADLAHCQHGRGPDRHPRPGHRARGGHPCPGSAKRKNRRHRDDRPAAGHPALASGQRLRRRALQLASDVPSRRRRSRADRHRGLARLAPFLRDHHSVLSGSAGLPARSAAPAQSLAPGSACPGPALDGLQTPSGPVWPSC